MLRIIFVALYGAWAYGRYRILPKPLVYPFPKRHIAFLCKLHSEIVLSEWSILGISSFCVLANTDLVIGLPSFLCPTTIAPSHRPSTRFLIVPSPFVLRFAISVSPFSYQQYHKICDKSSAKRKIIIVRLSLLSTL